ncbi:MAG: tripartite tricarboxylate transporter TctB family protein [Acidiferrobacterales bacterium]
MRRAELIMGVVMAIFSVYLMWKSAELPIGWLPGEGPGGGAFPFWLSAGMLMCCVIIIIRWFTRATPPARSSEPYMDPHALRLFLIGAGALTVMIGSIHIIGVYGAIPLFLVFYMRFIGRHPWMTTTTLAVITPITAFFFFEIALRITLPKGYTEPLFYPLYEFFFS